MVTMAEKTLRELALELYKPPFVFNRGYVYDNANCMVADDGDCKDKVERVRGWGRISYLNRPEELQDEFGNIMAEALNEFFAKHTNTNTDTIES